MGSRFASGTLSSRQLLDPCRLHNLVPGGGPDRLQQKTPPGFSYPKGPQIPLGVLLKRDQTGDQ